MNWKEKKKKYKVYIEWETEVEAENHEDAKIKGSESWKKAEPFLIVEEIKQMIKYYLNICPICDQETHYDQWAKPQVACIDCGFED